jgi:hypothetical protein
VLAGVAISVAIGVPAILALAPIPGSIATILGVAIGGFVAGKWADSAGAYHGALVGAGWIMLEAFGVVPSLRYSEDTITDTLIVFFVDLVTLIGASLAGWWARRGLSSSSGTGRGR